MTSDINDIYGQSIIYDSIADNLTNLATEIRNGLQSGHNQQLQLHEYEQSAIDMAITSFGIGRPPAPPRTHAGRVSVSATESEADTESDSAEAEEEAQTEHIPEDRGLEENEEASAISESEFMEEAILCAISSQGLQKRS